MTWVLDVAPFRDRVETELPREHEPRALLKLQKPMARMERAAQARTRLLEAPLGDSLERALASLWLRLEPLAPWGLAVRASPSLDDDSVASMAGLTGAELGVRGGPALADAVRRLWALVFSPRALSYLARRKVRDVAMAVLIQPVVVADVSGVMATRPPASSLSPGWRQGERLINAWWGLGPEVEGGDAACDVVRLATDGSPIDERIAPKHAMRIVNDEGPSLSPVSPERQTIACVQEFHRKALAALASRLDPVSPPAAPPAEPAPGAAPAKADAKADAKAEKRDEREEGEGYEVQFAFVGERLLVLQAQRGARRGYPQGGSEHTVWSRTTVTESLSGVVSPLTLSLSEPFVEESFRHTFERLGCSVPDDPLLAGVHGRAYLNLSALLRMAVQLPGMDARSVVQLAGVEGSEALERQLGEVSRRGFYSRLPMTAARQIAEQSTVGTQVEQFEALQADEERVIEEIDLAILPDDALVPRLRELRAMLGRATTTLATSTTAYVTTHLALKVALGRTFPLTADHHAQSLASGVATLEATRPAIALSQVAAIARDEPAARDRLLAGPLRRVDELPLGPTRAAMLRFLLDHGHHARLAVELMNPRWREDAAPVLLMLSALLRGGRSGDAMAASVRSHADRERAELERRMPMLDRLLARGLVDRCRRLADLRERARGRFLRTLALWRKAALEINRRLRRVDPSLDQDAVFFCSFDELLAALGTGRPRVAHLVKPRQSERERDLSMADPPTTFVGAPPAYLLPPSGGAVLRGVAASGGVAVGRARVVRDLLRDGAALAAGEILVVKSADLGLSPLFLVAGGLLSQQGGRLTQGSVVARELGLPAVASVPSATRAIRTGDLLRIDGHEGTVEIMQP